MRAEIVLWRVAILCAVLLFFAPMTPRTSWSYAGASEMRAEGGGNTHSAGWDWIAPIMGIVALAGLTIGRWPRPGIIRPSVCVAIASLCLGVATAAALGRWLDLQSGALAYGPWTIHPAPAVAYFAGIAAVGMVASLVPLGRWRQPAER